jgi:16S rRNA (guanine527-N7)-methyltransferase
MSWTQHAAEHFNIVLSDAQIEQFETLLRELVAWNETRMNLTAITEADDVRVRHFLDSLSIASVIKFDDGDQVIDVGTGAGFPGLPLAIVFPQIRVTLMEATAKKLTFIDHIVELLGLKNAVTLHARAEDAGQHPDHRAHYDVVTARAVARLPALLEYLLPLTKSGGYCIAMKGATAEDEAHNAQRALSILGGELRRIEAIQLPDVTEVHHLVTVEKVRKTPAAYPRKAGLPTKKPLGQ